MPTEYTNTADLHAEVAYARAQGKQNGYYRLRGIVRMTGRLGVTDVGHMFETSGTYTPANLRKIDLSGFALQGDFRGADLDGANFGNTLLKSVNFGPLIVNENSIGQSARDANPTGFWEEWSASLKQPDDPEFKRVFGIQRQIQTNLSSAVFNNSIAEDCDFSGCLGRGLQARDAIFRRSKFKEADLAGANRRGAQFIDCEGDSYWKSAEHDRTDPPLESQHGVELLHNIMAMFAIAALTLIAMHALHFWHLASVLIALTAVVIAFGDPILDAVNRTHGKWWLSFKTLNVPVLSLLCVEAMFGILHKVVDPEFKEISSGGYVIAFWVCALITYVGVRYFRTHSFNLRSFLTEPDSEGITLFFAALFYTFLYLIMHKDWILSNAAEVLQSSVVKVLLCAILVVVTLFFAMIRWFMRSWGRGDREDLER